MGDKYTEKCGGLAWHSLSRCQVMVDMEVLGVDTARLSHPLPLDAVLMMLFEHYNPSPVLCSPLEEAGNY